MGLLTSIILRTPDLKDPFNLAFLQTKIQLANERLLCDDELFT